MALRQTILEAAVTEFELHSEAGFRVTRVAEQAGCVVSVLYHHFANREGLIDAALVEIIRRDAEETAAIYEAIIGNVIHLRDVQQAFVDYTHMAHSPERAKSRALRIQILASSFTRPLVRRAWQEYSDQIQALNVRLLDAMKDRGLLDPSIPTDVIAVFMRTLDIGRALEESIETPFANFDDWTSFMGRIAKNVSEG